MEVLPPNYETVKRIQIDWDAWTTLDDRPKIIERGVDFIEDVSTMKRALYSQTAQRGRDVVVSVLVGNRLLFQVFDHSGAPIPKLPALPDGRKRHDWQTLFNGDEHIIEGSKSHRAYIYKVARDRDVTVNVNLLNNNKLKVRAHRALHT